MGLIRETDSRLPIAAMRSLAWIGAMAVRDTDRFSHPSLHFLLMGR
jgi:hypothetical protein